MKRFVLSIVLVLLALPAMAAPLPIRMVVVTAFQHGEAGVGEMRAWMADAPVKLPFAASDHPLRYDPVRRLLVVSTGMGSPRAAAAIMALGTDMRFDFRKSYWLVAAIAGIDPQVGSIGSAAWIGDVVDGDFGFEIDAREAPADWPTGKLPWFKPRPYDLPAPTDTSHNVLKLNPGLRDWAFSLTRAIALPDSAVLAKERAAYKGVANAPPSVLTGSELSGQSWWAGKLATEHARRWVDYWSGGRFAMSAMEDSGIARSLELLGKMDRADPQRLMILRTASDYTAPPDGVSASDYVAAIQKNLPATKDALAAAYMIGRPVVEEITTHWGRYGDTIPH